MLVDMYVTYTGLPAKEVERLLKTPAATLYQDKYYLDQVKSLNTGLLHDSSTYARAAYDVGLPELKAKYDLIDTVMSGYTLCNWVLGYLNYPDRLPDLIGQHDRIPVEIMLEMLPELVDLLEQVPEGSGRSEWQRAFLIITLPLLARKNG